MKPSFLTASLALTLILAAGSLQAQPGHFQNRIEYNPPSRFIHVDSPELDPRRFPDHPTLGFFGDFTRRGLIVTRVIRGSEACRIGLQPRDTILQANGYAIHCERDWQRALADACRDLRLKVRKPCGRIEFLRARLDVRGGGHSHHTLRATPRYQGLTPSPTGYQVNLGGGGLQFGFTIRN